MLTWLRNLRCRRSIGWLAVLSLAAQLALVSAHTHAQTESEAHHNATVLLFGGHEGGAGHHHDQHEGDAEAGHQRNGGLGQGEQEGDHQENDCAICSLARIIAATAILTSPVIPVPPTADRRTPPRPTRVTLKAPLLAFEARGPPAASRL